MEQNNNFESFAANNQAITQLQDAELSWDAQITEDAPEFTLLPEGDYLFVVESYERGRFNGSEKVKACNQLTVHLAVHNEANEVAKIRHNFFMLASKAGYIGAFLTCLGLKKPGEPMILDVNKLPGRTGKAHITVREYNGKKYNNIARFLKPEATTPAAAGFQGKF